MIMHTYVAGAQCMSRRHTIGLHLHETEDENFDTMRLLVRGLQRTLAKRGLPERT